MMSMHVTEDDNALIIESEQRSSDTQFHRQPIPARAGEPSAVLYAGYRRCSDFDTGDHAGQDYVAARADEHTIVGVVADGVGQSFYGDLAGCRVAKYLADFLWTRRGNPPSADELSAALLAEAAKFKEEIDAFVIPTHLAPVLQEALAETRTKGSQAVFAAFIFDIGASRAYIYQVGDVDVYLLDGDGRPERVQAPKRGRWSSGGHSDLLLRADCYPVGPAGMLVQTDGATEAWALGIRLGHGADLAAQFEALVRTRASVDDISFIGVSPILAPVRASQPDAPEQTPAPPAEPPLPSPKETAPESPQIPPGIATPAPRRAAKAPTLSRRWGAALFVAGALTAYVSVWVWHQVRAVMASAPKPPSASQPPARPSVVTQPVARLQVASEVFDDLRVKVGGMCPIRHTEAGEVSVWVTVPPNLNVTAFRVRSGVQEATVSATARNPAQRVFRVVFANMPQRQTPAEAELLGPGDTVVARGPVTLTPRDVTGEAASTRGYYLLERVPPQ